MSEAGKFFAVDHRCVEAACKLTDGLTLGVGYLVLARYSGSNHSSTKAGMTALHRHLGLSRGRADGVLKGLENSGLVSQPGRGGTRRLVPWAEFNAGGVKLTERQRAVMARVRSKRQPIISSTDPDYQVAYALAGAGVLVATKAGQDKPKFAPPQPEFVYLPNTIVDGFRDGDAPLTRLRQIGDQRALRLLAYVYLVTDLPEHGGIPRALHPGVKYKRLKVCDRGGYTVWAFARDAEYTSGREGPAQLFLRGKEGRSRDEGLREFWALWTALQEAKLIETVSYLFENEDSASQALHPYPVSGGTEEEREVKVEAARASLRLASQSQIEAVVVELEYRHVPDLCPAPSHAINVQLIGITRPVHRANTSRTRAWAKIFLQGSAEHAAIFRRLGRSSAESTVSPVTSMKDQ